MYSCENEQRDAMQHESPIYGLYQEYKERKGRGQVLLIQMLRTGCENFVKETHLRGPWVFLWSFIQGLHERTSLSIKYRKRTVTLL